MSTSNINIRVDTKVKEQAEALFNELGLNMSSALNLFLRHSIRYGGIPFEVRLIQPNDETRSAIDDVNENRNLSKTFDRIPDLMNDLNA
ncbi:MAG TPA: type II toxin-antitoxin system RelB/DinJ family antitoxin [Clostridiales bacterium]|jgi:DNA-damage-inducible protein J|nr:type II toxin-antitoxin system RelB/DinJ family antitoxin [Clostridiales bacterium]